MDLDDTSKENAPISITGGALVYTRAEVAEVLKVSLKTVERLIYAGQLKAFKVGTQWRVARAELLAYMKRQEFVA